MRQQHATGIKEQREVHEVEYASGICASAYIRIVSSDVVPVDAKRSAVIQYIAVVQLASGWDRIGEKREEKKSKSR